MKTTKKNFYSILLDNYHLLYFQFLLRGVKLK